MQLSNDVHLAEKRVSNGLMSRCKQSSDHPGIVASSDLVGWYQELGSQVPRHLAVQIQIEILVQFEFLPRNLFEYLDLVDFRVVAFSVETVIHVIYVMYIFICIL